MFSFFRFSSALFLELRSNLQQRDLHPPLGGSSYTNTQPSFSQTGQMIELFFEYLSAWCILTVFIIMSCIMEFQSESTLYSCLNVCQGLSENISVFLLFPYSDLLPKNEIRKIPVFLDLTMWVLF